MILNKNEKKEEKKDQNRRRDINKKDVHPFDPLLLVYKTAQKVISII